MTRTQVSTFLVGPTDFLTSNRRDSIRLLLPTVPAHTKPGQGIDHRSIRDLFHRSIRDLFHRFLHLDDEKLDTPSCLFFSPYRLLFLISFLTSLSLCSFASQGYGKPLSARWASARAGSQNQQWCRAAEGQLLHGRRKGWGLEWRRHGAKGQDKFQGHPQWTRRRRRQIRQGMEVLVPVVSSTC